MHALMPLKAKICLDMQLFSTFKLRQSDKEIKVISQNEKIK